MSDGARKKDDDHAIEVWVALEKAAPDGLTWQEIVKITGLSRPQMRRGITRINQVLQEGRGQPLVVDTKTWRYVLPEHYSEFAGWAAIRQKDLWTRTKTEVTRWNSAAAKWPESPAARLVKKHLGRLVEDIGDAIKQVEATQ